MRKEDVYFDNEIQEMDVAAVLKALEDGHDVEFYGCHMLHLVDELGVYNPSIADNEAYPALIVKDTYGCVDLMTLPIYVKGGLEYELKRVKRFFER